ncbi:hypothetical protein [Paraburkholderia lycopersici]|uniref:Lipoprotein n=1 Tax=Paraburkholderia lycopersici TaxID=416944 RepID=A0A1G6I8Q3_9BURK|nr:hypothetical protein [Paraburkholderia lycopersici]SDC02405.1 hypothetical protein SAMN05421548_103288 [Paraburkholderia lycopersici]
MNIRNACFAGLAAAVTLLAGCAAQYRNTSTCEEEMRNRLAGTTLGELKVTHSATTYRGARVVIEGRLEHGTAPAAAALPAQAASEVVQASSGAAANVQEAPRVTAPTGVAAPLPGMMSVPVAPAAAQGTASESKPTTPVAELAAKLGIKKAVHTPAAAECTFNESGLATFHWLAPAPLAKTTPAPNADE